MTSPEAYPEDATSPDDVDYSNGDVADYEDPDEAMAEEPAGGDGEHCAQQSGSNGSPTEGTKPKDGVSRPTKSSAKDPLRPRRKKARRACFACQRAHLTCGMSVRNTG